MKEISVSEVKAKLDAGDDFQFIDVREENEYEYCNLGAQLMPLGDLMMQLDKISKDKDVVIHCKSGGRSGNVVNALMSRGYNNVMNMKGGILAWSAEIDNSIPTY